MDIGFQLYSARNYPLADVLKKVAALGYTQVEGYGALYANPDPAALKALLDQNGLTMPTAHISLGDLEDTAKTLKLAETLGIKVVVCPWLAPEQRPTSAAGWTAFGEKLQKIGKPFQDAGLGFGYHNHAFEFVTYDGRYGMDYLLEAAPAVDCEADVAWIVRGGADPGRWLEANGQRIIAVHVKDLAPAGEALDEAERDARAKHLLDADMVRLSMRAAEARARTRREREAAARQAAARTLGLREGGE